jgi:hypothetical protein
VQICTSLVGLLGRVESSGSLGAADIAALAVRRVLVGIV